MRISLAVLLFGTLLLAAGVTPALADEDPEEVIVEIEEVDEPPVVEEPAPPVGEAAPPVVVPGEVVPAEVVDHGPRLERWGSLLERMMDRGVKSLVYVNNHYAGHGRSTVRRLMDIYRRRADGEDE